MLPRHSVRLEKCVQYVLTSETPQAHSSRVNPIPIGANFGIKHGADIALSAVDFDLPHLVNIIPLLCLTASCQYCLVIRHLQLSGVSCRPCLGDILVGISAHSWLALHPTCLVAQNSPASPPTHCLPLLTLPSRPSSQCNFTTRIKDPPSVQHHALSFQKRNRSMIQMPHLG